MPGLGPNVILDTIKSNCRFFLEGKWSHLYHTACILKHSPSLPAGTPSAPPPSPLDERQIRLVWQLVQSGSLSAAYQRLTEPGLFRGDPLSRFLEIHPHTDLSALNLHPDIVQAVLTDTDWDKVFSPDAVFSALSRRKNGKA